MKKYIIYFGILVIGLVLGWLLFGGSSKTETEHNHTKVLQKPIKCGPVLCILKLCNRNLEIVLFVEWI